MTENMRKIIAIGAHPDDIELGCGGMLRKHVINNDEIYYIVMSLGEKSGDKNKRKSETLEAARMIGACKVNFLYLPDTMIMHDGKTVGLLDKHIEEIEPEIIYVHSPKDYHQDHENTAKSVLSSARNMKTSIFFYETPSTTIEFRPVAYQDVSEVFEYKLKCIDQYISQKNKDYMEKEAIVGLAKTRGFTMGVRYAEAFEVGRLFKW